MIVTIPETVEGQNIDQLLRLDNMEVKQGEEYALTLIFDHQFQGKEINLNGSFPLTLKY